MADIFQEFKEHARTFHKDIKILEKAFSNPRTFYGTEARRAEANVILKNELESTSNININIGELIQEMEDIVSDNDQLLKQLDNASEDLTDIRKLLEGFGFIFSEENEVSDSNEENKRTNVANGNEEYVNIQEHSEDLVKEHIRDYLTSNERCEEILESTEKYLEDNNISLDDIVTPLFHRNSLYSGKKS